ncbi:pentatricopeptide repeat-containing protein [Pyrus ussuriensis x Pyrus communis]|uniref:Pentatricopeptide repeat-containing protein n=1 Tax=Pyrus ussuriensis x Pyrus communis TaxID=2448454 RepID=A0A5N5HDS3_9ROSA|nr:pentatricopeptide repeat-containing protein [Pyrus ussuriensis x Pyrus communis]
MEALPSAQIQRLMVTENSINTVHYKHSRNVKPTTKVAVTHIANGDFHQVLTTCHQMLLRSIHLDRHTLLRVLSAYRPISLSASNSMATLPSANPGFAIVHGHAHKLVCSANRYVVATLIELYGHLDGADAAKGLFDKYPQHPLLRALFLVLCWQGCTLGKVIKPGKAVHVFGRMMESGAQIGSVAVATAAGACGMLRSLIDGTKVHRVGKEGGLEYETLEQFLKDVISWTEMIHANVKRGGLHEGLKLVLPACARTSAGKHGKEIHGFLLRNGIRMNLTILNALRDMYVKSGFIQSAVKVLPTYRSMKSHMPLSFMLALLHALLRKGSFNFICIKTPTVAPCLAGSSSISRKKIEGHAEALRAPLDGCRIHLQLNLGRRVIESSLIWKLFMPTIREMVDEVRGMITDMDLRPNKPYTWTELENKIHAFGTGDVAHRRSQGIGLELQCLMQKMEGKGQRPESDFSFRDVDEERGCWPFLLASSVHNPGASYSRTQIVSLV